MTVRVGFLGPCGTFTEKAMQVYTASRQSCVKVEFSSIPEMIYAVGGEIDEAVVPFENSIEGSVNVALDLLIHEVAVKIRGELVLPVKQNLFAKRLYPLDDIEAVYSHPQALYQCRKFLQKRLPKAQWMETASTGEAARIVAASDGPRAAIGHSSLGGLYDLLTLAEDIQDHKNNMTRFIILSTEDCAPTGSDKTSVVFATENRPGSLYRVLGFFARENLNLTKIESRPSRKALGEYVFFLEVEGHRQDDALKKVLAEVAENTMYFKILGSYPRWQEGYPPGPGG